MSLPDDGISLCFVGSSSFICGIYNSLLVQTFVHGESHYSVPKVTIKKMKNKNTTLSEQFQNTLGQW
jgi:hypothetical protein